MGTPHYFSPEQARGLDLDGRTDLYSLGVMCYRAATGVLPFEGDDWYSVARQHVEETPVPPRMLVAELTEGFESIVLRLLAKKPEHRFASATQLADALLTLPTAPTSRSVGLTPSSASVTQVAFPYLYAAAGKRSWKRNVLLASIAVSVTAVAALFATPVLNEWRLGTRVNPESLGTKPITLDSMPFAGADSAPGANVLALQGTTLPKAPVKPAASVTRTPPAPTHVNISVSVPDSTLLTVNDEPKVPQNGTWQGTLPTGTKQHFVARHERTIPGCKSDHIDTLIGFNSALANVEFDIAPCSILLLTILSTNNAEYFLTGKGFHYPGNGKYTGTPLPIVLRNGEYELVVTADKCNNYTDAKLIIGRDRNTGSDTVKKSPRLDCATPTPIKRGR